MATIIYRRTMHVHMDKLNEAMEIATEQAKIFKELTGNETTHHLLEVQL